MCVHVCVCTLLCPTLCNPTYYSLLGFSVHGIFQARILEWVAIFFSRRSSQSRDRIRLSCVASRLFNAELSGKPKYSLEKAFVGVGVGGHQVLRH